MSDQRLSAVDAVTHEWSVLLDTALDRIRHCVGQLSYEELWWRPAEGMNSVGILLRHLRGNLKQWIVEGVPQLNGSRDRAAEFESPEQQTAELLLDDLSQVCAAAQEVIRSLDDAMLAEQRQIQGFDVTVSGAVMHSVPHFVGHTHQIVQLTRMQLGDEYQQHWSPQAKRTRVPL